MRSTNPAVERLFVYPGHVLIGLDIGELIDTGPNQLPLMSRIVSSQSADGSAWELDARRADGRYSR